MEAQELCLKHQRGFDTRFMPFFTEWMKERSQVMLKNEENSNRKESSLNKTQQLQSQNDNTP